MHRSKILLLVLLEINFILGDLPGEYFGGYEHGGLGLGHFGKIGSDFGSAGLSHGLGGFKHFGGSHLDQDFYSGGKNRHDGEHFFKQLADHDAHLSHDEGGFKKGEGVFKDIKGDAGYFRDIDGQKKGLYDGRDHYEAKQFDKEGKAGDEKSQKQGHKKGHTVKGFTTSHHKDEHGKTEEFFDDSHDEGGNVAFSGQSGKFGEVGKGVAKGAHEDGKFTSGDSKKGVHYAHESVDGKAHSNHGHFDGSEHGGHGAVLGEHKVFDEGDIHGHHDSSRLFKHHPSYF